MSESGKLELYLSGDAPPSHDLAREAWLMTRAAAGRPALFLYSWPGPVVVLGYGQPSEDVDLEFCRAQRIQVLRRLSGGTGVIHQQDLAVSLVLPREHHWARGIVSLYGRFLDALAPALTAAGGAVERLAHPKHASRERSAICFEDRTADTLISDGRKVVGCAQTRRGGAVLIHAAILLDLDAALYARVFRAAEERVRAHLGAAVRGARWREVGQAVADGLARALGLDLEPTQLPPEEELELEPYATSRWAPLAGFSDDEAAGK